MIARKPSIFIYARNPDQVLLSEICAGIEEEGVLYEVFEKEGKTDDLAYDAANDSMLGSGIGIWGSEVRMQMRGLDRGKNVFGWMAPDSEQGRRLGANSARAVKKISFKKIEG